MGRGIAEEALVLLRRRLCDLNFIFSLFSDSPDNNYSKLKFIVSNSVIEAVTIRYCFRVLEDAEKLRLKIFNGQFEELHQRQSQWTVPDIELRESIRLAVVEVLLPVYRSFIKCFGYKALVENGKNPIKYIRSSHRGGCYCRYNGTTLSIRIFNSVSSKAMDDPFVVLETTSTPITSPPSVFIDPLETVHKMNEENFTEINRRTKRRYLKHFHHGMLEIRKRRYVKLYKLKLECLRKEQPLEDEIVLELDQIEKVSDIEDTLGYRSAAEHELQV
ncbi:unnamed protein product [Lactuca saligna]|uniref:Exocyst subunit Exo70 family protein n=1 Tax=Lactuca saligna TaxID=75948 RepID=A0AA35Y8C8_LACSI|nr:unnamed protein product [Lactuca saligna]